MIKNPILPGFNADPSICRVGDDYYIATSTFEWYPGVQIHHSTDLVNWTLVARPLNRAALLDMRGNPDSCGIWAPCLSYSDGRFWLVYTDVKRLDGAFKDAHNYITNCATINGDWSDPIYVSSHGFDPSLFHDDDGRKYWMVLKWNHRGEGTGGNPKHSSFDGILLQQWSEQDGLIGPIKSIYDGTDRGLTEGPHIFKRGDYYYLTTAEGGTGYDHAVTMARSKSIWGPYENHPDLHLLTAAGHPDHPIQRTGHGQYVETGDGEYYHTFLMGRPIKGENGKGNFCPLGRETGIEKCVWREDNWLYLEAGGQLARLDVPSPTNAKRLPDAASEADFSDNVLPSEFQWLRHPHPERLFKLEDGCLKLIGRESVGSWFEQSLVARRQEHFKYQAETCLEFTPETYQHAAGLTTYYNRGKFHMVWLTHEVGTGPALTVLSCNGDYPDGALTYWLDAPVSIGEGAVELRIEVDHAEQQFFWRKQGDKNWQAIGPKLDASVISDEGGRGEHASFTGAFVGMFAMDITGQGKQAQFKRFAYMPN